MASSIPISRRNFLQAGAAIAAAAAARPDVAGAAAPNPPQAVSPMTAPATSPGIKPDLFGIQIPAVSFIDEGVDAVLDLLQEKGHINTLFVSVFSYDSGTGGRQISNRPLPDHGARDYGQFHGGNYATPHAQFYKDTVLKETKAPDHGDVDILELVIPKARKRGMKVFAWNVDTFRRDIPNIGKLQEVNLQGERVATCCAYNPDYRNFVLGLTRDLCSSYELDGLMWGSEHQGPLHNLITNFGYSKAGTTACFCDFHKQAAKERGIDVARALEGYKKLDAFMAAARNNQRPVDGYFVEFWRQLLDCPELLAWEKLWTDGKYSIYEGIYQAAKAIRPDLPVGFHIWQEASFSPFHRAEQTFERMIRYIDFIKPVVYNNAAGPRYAAHIRSVAQAVFHDLSPEELMLVNNRMMNYEERPIGEIPTQGLSPDYVARETRRTIAKLPPGTPVYPGIDVDVPTRAGDKQTRPEDVSGAATAALQAGARGIIFSRKYSEMRLANLEAGGNAIRTYLASRR